jgi:predicted PurR-regulated permease PerM
MSPTPPSPASSHRVGGIVLAAAVILAGLWVLRDFLPALAWAAVFAIALWPLYERLNQLLPGQSQRLAAPLLLTLAVTLVFVVPITLVVIQIAREASVLVPLVSQARKHGIPPPDWLAPLPWLGAWLEGWWRDHLSDPTTAEALLGHIDTHTIAVSAREIGAEIVHRLAIFLFTLLALFFLFRDGTSLMRELLLLSDRWLGDRGERIALHMVAAVHATVNGLVLVGLAEGAVIGVAYVAVGLPHAVPVAALTGVLAVIPFAAPVVFCVAGLFLLADFNVVGAIVVVSTGFFVVFVADHFIRPVLIGGATRLPFLWVLLGILGGLESFGILGLFLGPAIMAALISLWREETEPLPAVAPGERVSGAQMRP